MQLNRKTILVGLLAVSAATLAPGALKDAAGHLDSSVRAKLALYPYEPADSVVPSELISSTLGTVEFKYDWATWCETGGGIRLDTSGWLEYGRPNAYRWKGGVDLFQDDEVLSRPLVISELYATAPLGNLDLIAGRAVTHNSLAVLYPLADRYVTRDFNDPTDPKTIGVWQTRANLYLADWQLSLAALPVFQPPKVPGMESRWWIRDLEPIIGEPVPPGAEGRVERSVPGVSVKNTGALATIKTRQQNWDFFTTAYHGYSAYPVTRLEKPEPDYYLVTQEYLPGFEWSSGISTTIDEWELHTEALYHRTSSGDDDEYVNGLAGFIWSPGVLAELLRCNQVHLIAEYSREHILAEQKESSGYVSSSEPFRFGRNTMLTQCLLDINNRDTAALAYIQNFAEQNALVQLRAGHRFGNGIHLEAVLEIFDGQDLYFGTWSKNDRIYTTITYHF